MFYIKTEVTDDICLITVECKGKVIQCLTRIKKELKQRNIKTYYSSILSLSGKNNSIIIAIGENDLYPWLALISCIKDNTDITGCTMNSSNTQICWDKSDCNIYDIAEKYEDKIRLIYECNNKGCIICENQIKHKLTAKIEAL